ncbi:MAG TPA: phospholipid carrier-dependent glycosyltransferase [Candidatus Lokiarchaeia archaeon]|nr:phospholipid carrier-dependent glycosyltransferase [Candidatus Lokiarchaeia archaeon]
MQSISIPSRDSRLNVLYTVLQYVSSSLVIVGGIADTIGVPDYIRWISAVNAYAFFIFFLGTNVLISIKKSPQISFELFMILELCAGAFIQYAAGMITFFLSIPYCSEIAEIAIAGCNMILLLRNQSNNQKLTVTFNEDSKILIIIGIVFFVLRIFTINPGNFYLDDQVLFGMAQGFANNQHNLLPIWSNGTYNGKTIEMPFEIGFSISLGIITKLGFPASTAFSIIFLKAYLTIQTTFIIFPVYSFLSRTIKQRSSVFILLIILVFNQVLFIESPYLLPETTLMMFFTTAFYYFILVLEKDGPTNENMIFCAIASALAMATKSNGLFLFVMQLVILLIIYFVSKIKRSWKQANEQGNLVTKWIQKIKVPEFSSIFRIILFQLVLLLIFYGSFEISYYINNGITIADYLERVPSYGYFGVGTSRHFYTPVDTITFTWLLDHLSFNFPWFVVHFTQLMGFIHIFSGNDILSILLNFPLSIILVVIFGVSMIYMWYKTARTYVLSAFFQVTVFLLTFATIITWGEVYFSTDYRWTYPFLILIVPPIYGTFKDFFGKIKHVFHRNFDVERILPFLLLPFLVLTIYSTICFLIPIYSGNPDTLKAYLIWQFAENPFA